ncbi:MAG TPA: glycosyl transferase family 1, partial [Planctomycetaceae bacterium]|nr:glycosyl transferase family 1 [Planctomycetaceae bacterium]
MRILHLTASPFFGGPERVILDLVRTQSAPDFEYTGHRFESVIATFGENGGCAPFLGEIEKTGLEGLRLVSDMPRLDRAVGELMRLLRGRRTDLVCAHG